MSKKWKIIIAAVIALVVMVFAGAGWYINQGWTPGTLAQGQELTHSLEVRLIDDNGDKVPDRGVVDLPASRGFERGAGADQLAARLVDDNKDGIPDRGIIDHSPKGTFSPDFGSARGRPFGLLLVPFCFIGGLIGLGLVAGLAIFFYRRRPFSPPAAPVSPSPTPDEVQPEPVEVEPTPDETRLEPSVAIESTGDESNEVAMDNTP